MVHTPLDMAGDERHDTIAHHKGGMIGVEGVLGFITADKGIVGAVGSTRTRWRGKGKWKRKVDDPATWLETFHWNNLVDTKEGPGNQCG